jgi:hypothetical protein
MELSGMHKCLHIHIELKIYYTRHDITDILLKVALKAYRLSEMIFFYIKSCFILIAVEIFHIIIRE